MRGDYISAGLDAFGVIPVVGEVADTAKLARAGIKVADKAHGAGKVIDAVKIADKADDVAADTLKVADDVYDYSKFPQKIHEGNQRKHIIGSNEYKPEKGRSIVTISGERIMELVKKYTGTGRCHNSYRETVDFGEVIGKYIDPETGIAYDTTRVTIHYSQKGFHIVPAKPENWRKKK